MKLEWLGHSSFLITNAHGDAIVTDPYKTEDVGVRFPKISCKTLLISHDHFDHNYVDGVNGVTRMITGAGATQEDDFIINGIGSFHDDKKGALRGPNVIYRIESDGVTVCHMGDIGEPVTDELVNQIGKVDVLLIPVGGIYTVDAIGAKEYVDKINPSVVIPMHYGVPGYVIEFNKVDEFLNLFPKDDVIYADGALEFKPSDFTSGVTKVIVANKRN